MMTRQSKYSAGMTLTELIVASVLVGIVTLGLIAAEHAVRVSRQSSVRDNLVTTQMQAMMIAITKDINNITGDYASTGIFLQDTPPPFINLQSACFRYAAQNINIYTDDLWSCWTFDRPSGVLLSCKSLDAPVLDCSVSAGAQDWSSLRHLKLGITAIDTNEISIPSTGLITNRSIARIHIRIKTRYDLNRPMHDITNPDYELESMLSPVGLSR